MDYEAYERKLIIVVCEAPSDILFSLQFGPKQLLAFMPRFKAHLASLQSGPQDDVLTDDQVETIKHLKFFIRFMESEYESTLREIATLLAQGKMTFDLLWAILLPAVTIVTTAGLTGEPRAGRLVSADIVPSSTYKPRYWNLKCEYVDFTQNLPSITDVSFEILDYEGSVAVTDLESFPMDPFLPEPARTELKTRLIARGKRYTELSVAWCHKRYSGIAYKPKDNRKIGVRCVLSVPT